jgi:plasmid stabilization system protein ParE
MQRSTQTIFLHFWSGKPARAWLKDMPAYIVPQRLLRWPESGAPRPRLGEAVRIAIVSPYVMIYEYNRDDDTLVLLRMLHGRRNITDRLLRR